MPIALQAGDVGGREDAALADEHAILRHQRREPLADGEDRLEGAEVAVVDADQRATQRERARQLGLVVDLDQHVHAERERRVLDRAAPRRR